MNKEQTVQFLWVDNMEEPTREDFIKDVLMGYGLNRILEDNGLSLIEALDILDELGFVYLDMYELEEDYYE